MLFYLQAQRLLSCLRVHAVSAFVHPPRSRPAPAPPATQMRGHRNFALFADARAHRRRKHSRVQQITRHSSVYDPPPILTCSGSATHPHTHPRMFWLGNYFPNYQVYDPHMFWLGNRALAPDEWDVAERASHTASCCSAAVTHPRESECSPPSTTRPETEPSSVHAPDTHYPGSRLSRSL